MLKFLFIFPCLIFLMHKTFQIDASNWDFYKEIEKETL